MPAPEAVSVPAPFCPACDYDLRGLPPCTPCPECGEEVAPGHVQLRGHGLASTVAAGGWAGACGPIVSGMIRGHRPLVAAALVALSLAAIFLYESLLRRRILGVLCVDASPDGLAVREGNDAWGPRDPWSNGDVIARSRLPFFHRVTISRRNSRGVQARLFTLHTRASREHVDLFVERCDAWVLAATAPATPARPCPSCSAPSPLLDEACLACGQDLRAAPLVLRGPSKLRARRTILAAIAAGGPLLILLAVGIVGTPDRRFLDDALVGLGAVLIASVALWLARRRRAGELRIAPSGWQLARPGSPLRLDPWCPSQYLHADVKGVSLAQLAIWTHSSIQVSGARSYVIPTAHLHGLESAVRRWTARSRHPTS